jgi:hypothetical protein
VTDWVLSSGLRILHFYLRIADKPGATPFPDTAAFTDTYLFFKVEAPSKEALIVILLTLRVSIALCANMSETSSPSTITVGRGKKSHFDKHEQDKLFLRCVGSFGA